MIHYGDYPTSATVRIWVQTRNAEGSPLAPSSAFEVADFVLYKDGSATQRSSNAGWTITSPFDSRTGLHLLEIDTSDNTDNGFYAAGSEYMVYLVPDETVDTIAVGEPVAMFSIQRSGGILALLKDGTSGLAALETLVDGVESAIGALNDLDSTEVQTAAAAALTAYDPPTKAELDSAVAPLALEATVAALENLSAAQVNAQVDQALADYDGPTNAEMVARTLAAASYATAANLTTVDTVVDAIKLKTDSLTFTVAGQVDANALSMNDAEVEGTGVEGDLWRGVGP